MKTRLKRIRRNNILILSLFYCILFSMRSKEAVGFKITANSSFLFKSCFNYTVEWKHDSTILDDLTKENEPFNCKTCNYNLDSWPGDSTNRDAIITFCFVFPGPFIPFIRSIRTTKCKAKIIILCDQKVFNAFSHEKFYKYRKNCDFRLINIGSVHFKGMNDLYQGKTFVYRDFLHSYGFLFDRVIMCDISDTVFQSDPFKPFMRSDAAYCYTENFTIEEERVALAAYKKIGEDLDKKKLIVTPAVYFGNPFEVLKLVDFTQTYFFDKEGNNVDIHDQAVNTLVYYKKYYVDYGINMKQVDWNGGIISANTHYLQEPKIGETICIGCKVVPFLIHHFEYIEYLNEDFYRHCPREKNMRNGKVIYQKGLTNERMDEIDKELSINL